MSKKIKYLVLIIICCISFISHGQYSDRNPSLSLGQYLSGVKEAFVLLDEKNAKFINDNPNSATSFAIAGIIQYLNNLGFEKVTWGSKEMSPHYYESICDLTFISPSWSFSDGFYSNISKTFISCKGDKFKLQTSAHVTKIRNDNATIKSGFFNVCTQMYNTSKEKFKIENRLSLTKEITNWSKDRLHEHFKTHGTDPIEGI